MLALRTPRRAAPPPPFPRVPSLLTPLLQLLDLGRLVAAGEVSGPSLAKEQKEGLHRVRRTAQLLESSLVELDRDLAVLLG